MINDLKITQLCPSVGIVESTSDRYQWGNATEDEPAFLVYIGCENYSEAQALKKTLFTFYRCQQILIRPALRMNTFSYELKVHRMQRNTDSYAYGLDLLVESQEAKDKTRTTEPENLEHLAYFDSVWA
jgi:hypothetical protein